MKYLIAGLGNIGSQYANTRHNIGFMILDALANEAEVDFADKRYAFRAEMAFKGRKLVLIKPSTLMNRSGNAIRYWLNKEKLDVGNLLVIVDDIALPFGSVRIRAKGGDAGHNGLVHINDVLGTQAYARLRFGIGNEFPIGRQIKYVLDDLEPEETKTLKEKMPLVKDAVKDFAFRGTTYCMNHYNNK